FSFLKSAGMNIRGRGRGRLGSVPGGSISGRDGGRSEPRRSRRHGSEGLGGLEDHRRPGQAPDRLEGRAREDRPGRRDDLPPRAGPGPPGRESPASLVEMPVPRRFQPVVLRRHTIAMTNTDATMAVFCQVAPSKVPKIQKTMAPTG
ncbi:hypothetical protein, partial [Bremerella sp. JC817]|uniref:hypothetical protein n=1 Tax=Bremerella sp. JC817 TaxID=3231756 RepID=UPI003459D33A